MKKKYNNIFKKIAFSEEYVFKRCFIGVYFNLRNPIIGFSIGFTSVELYVLSFNVLIAQKLD